jgi:hypothetical protein
MGTYQEIDVGTTANDGTGDPLRTAMIKVNESLANAFSNPTVTSWVTVGNTTSNVILTSNSTAAPSVQVANATNSSKSVVNTYTIQVSNNTYTANLTAAQLSIGNTTSGAFRATVNSSVIAIGNATSNVFANGTNISIANNTQGSIVIHPNRILVGANVSINNQAISCGNTSANLLLDYSIVRVANGTSGQANVEPGKITVGANVTINTTMATLPAANVVSNTGFTLGSHTAAANGYTFLPNGLKMTWGWVLSNTSTGSISFADVFSTAVFSITATGNTADYVYFTARTVSGATVRTSNATATNVYYIAIGK